MTKMGYTKADVAALQRIGLTKTQAQCYLLLNKTNGLTAGQLADELGASRTNIYSLLDDLKQKGFVTEFDLVTPAHYHIVPLATAFLAYTNYQRDQLKALLIKQLEKKYRPTPHNHPIKHL